MRALPPSAREHTGEVQSWRSEKYPGGSSGRGSPPEYRQAQVIRGERASGRIPTWVWGCQLELGVPPVGNSRLRKESVSCDNRKRMSGCEEDQQHTAGEPVFNHLLGLLPMTAPSLVVFFKAGEGFCAT